MTNIRYAPGKCTVLGGGKCPNLGVVNVRILGVVNVRILGVVNVRLANDLPPSTHFLILLSLYDLCLVGLGVGVGDTQSDSIQCLNLPKNDSFNIRFNIALPKIQFKI